MRKCYMFGEKFSAVGFGAGRHVRFFPIPRRGRGFTLIEILVVVSIIAILAGMMIPTYYFVKERAREAKARVEVKQIESALKAYIDTYKVWRGWPAGAVLPIDGSIFMALTGDEGGTPLNPQKIPFFEFQPVEGLNTTLQEQNTAWDPWSNPNDKVNDPAKLSAYYVAIDINYDGRIQFDVSRPVILRSVVVWSIGKNRIQEFGDGDDIASWK